MIGIRDKYMLFFNSPTVILYKYGKQNMEVGAALFPIE